MVVVVNAIAEWAEFPDVAHTVNVEKPAEFNELLLVVPRTFLRISLTATALEPQRRKDRKDNLKRIPLRHSLRSSRLRGNNGEEVSLGMAVEERRPN